MLRLKVSSPYCVDSIYLRIFALSSSFLSCLYKKISKSVKDVKADTKGDLAKKLIDVAKEMFRVF